MLYEGDRVVGVRTGDKGIDKHGKKKGNFEPGVDLRAKVTILAEGARGSLTKQLVPRLELDAGKFPQVYSIGIKELWEVPKGRLAKGAVLHTMGYPARPPRPSAAASSTASPTSCVSIGPRGRPRLSRSRSSIRTRCSSSSRSTRCSARMLEGGKLVRYGARTISEGGWYSIPRPYADGVLLVGESAGYLNAMRLKGIHLGDQDRHAGRGDGARRACVADDTSAARLKAYEDKVDGSYVKRELWKVRNFHQGFKHGLFAGLHPQRPADVHGRPRPLRPDAARRRATRRSRASRTATAPARRATTSSARRWTASSPSTA